MPREHSARACPLCGGSGSEPGPAVVIHHGLVLDRSRSTLAWGAGTVRITPQRVAIMAALMASAPETVHRDRMRDVLWGGAIDGGPLDPDHVVSMHVHYLRRALAELRAPASIRNTHAVGYRLVVDPDTWPAAGLREPDKKLADAA